MRALILVDIQNDFCPGGSLEVPEGDQVVPVANRLQHAFELVVAGQDWHPPDHLSFAEQHPGHEVGEVIEVAGLSQILWPVHCVQDTPGARFHSALQRKRIAHIVRKGTDREIDSYSAFFDNGHRRATGLADYLQQRGVTDVFVCGLATEYCVKFTALDAVELGFTTHVVLDGCRGVNLQAGDVDKALDEMREAGVQLVRASEI